MPMGGGNLLKSDQLSKRGFLIVAAHTIVNGAALLGVTCLTA